MILDIWQDLRITPSLSKRSPILCTVVTTALSVTAFSCSLCSNDNATYPNKLRCIVSLNVVALKLTTCHLRFGGSPLLRDLDSSVSPISTRRDKSGISDMYLSTDSVLSKFLFSKRVVFSH